MTRIYIRMRPSLVLFQRNNREICLILPAKYHNESLRDWQFQRELPQTTSGLFKKLMHIFQRLARDAVFLKKRIFLDMFSFPCMLCLIDNRSCKEWLTSPEWMSNEYCFLLGLKCFTHWHLFEDYFHAYTVNAFHKMFF